MSTLKHVELNWQTADGFLIPFGKVTHQHWSNIYWYHLIFAHKLGMPKKIMLDTAKFASNRIDKDFNGEILEWKPIYMYEVRWLMDLHMLAEGIRIENRNEIFYKGKKIGTIVEEDLREVKGIN